MLKSKKIVQLEPVLCGSIMLELFKHYMYYDPETGHFHSTGVKYSGKMKGDRLGSRHKTKGYRYLTLKGKTYREHRVAFLFMTGSWPRMQVDHINGIEDDNRWCNLRDVEPVINSENRGVWSTNTSGYRGVVWNKRVGKWQVLCRYRGKQLYMGLYDEIEEAARVADMTYKHL